ncbi:hypothetical protein KRR38_29755 [Novosphingobium sp. G106]|uniref:hypothetical protein n=1 Tax=Novosphingobium sp. G106 TaxID=2849500 RepID=UPI001C2CD54E|nr:hypothetical protein [Novosphingobium sp. G106]MBV1691751.1 hypothetical protein [Novosphingobium sp. G106]
MNIDTLNRRAALGLMGAGVAATALPPLSLAAATAQPWLATPAQVAAERMLLELLKDPELKRIQGEIRAKLADSPRAKNIPDAMATLDGAIAQWTNSLIFAELMKDTARPGFLWATDDTPRDWLGHHLGGVGTSGDNPDNIYRTAGIEGGGRYEILGQYHPDSRPTQLLIEIHGVDLAQPSTMMTPTAKGGGKAPDPQASSQINQDALVVDAQGRFRITVGGEPSGPNHLAIPPAGFVSVGVRDVLSDWKQRAAGLTINRLDRVDAPAFGLEQARALVHRDLPGYIDFWSNFPNIWFGGLAPNTISKPQQRPGGWGFVAGINYHLAADEAQVITLDPGGSRYTGFQINDPWMIAPDARARQVCLNGSQVTPNADGTVTYVIAASDPGAANWLDTTGYHDGLAILRWQAIPPGLKGDGLIREFKVVKLSELAAIKGLPRVTPAERRARVAARKADYETRVR